MDNHFPTIKLSRGALSGPTQLAIAILLLLAATHLLSECFLDGVPMSGVLGSILAIVVYPFAMCWHDYLTGGCQMFFCDAHVLAIRGVPWKMHYVLQEDLERIVRDGTGYTFVLKNGRRFRMRRKDAGPQHRAVLDIWHARMEDALKSAKDFSGSTDS